MLKLFRTHAFTMSIIGFTAFSCTNPFSTREPEAPNTGNQTWIPPRRPEIVLENMKIAIRDQNVENYLRCLSAVPSGNARYVFIADAAVASEYPGTFERWTRDNERAYSSQIRAILPADSARGLSLVPVQTNVFADSALLVRDYTLVLRHTQQKQGVPGVVVGQARLWLRVDSFGDWAIYRWEDRSSGNDQTWSVFKAIFGQ